MSNSLSSRPPFSALPLDPDGPPGNAWGLYGSNDNLGSLNLLTPSVVAAAASEIKSGRRVNLDWSLDKPSYPSFSRQGLKHEIFNKTSPEMLKQGKKRTVNDDAVSFNTQSGSQWDGFRHYGYQKAKRYYNNNTEETIKDPKNIGIDAWAENGGIVGRAVLLDYYSFCQKHSIPISPLTSSSFPLTHIHQLIAEQNITFKPGDILFIRSGFTAAYNALSDSERKALAERSVPGFVGIEPTSSVVRWIWESQFAAVAGDTVAFEQCPPAGSHTEPGGFWEGETWEHEMQEGGLLHQWLLGGWGCPIGEMFDLEKLSETCKELGRWSFFVSSVPLKVPGGVASPPNAVAIF